MVNEFVKQQADSIQKGIDGLIRDAITHAEKGNYEIP